MIQGRPKPPPPATPVALDRKTYTAALLAIGLRRQKNLEGPIAFFDTEASAQYISQMILKETGNELLGFQSRSLSDAVTFLKTCEEQGVSVAIVDSVSHLWDEVKDTYLKQKNEALVRRGKNPKSRLEFQDWMIGRINRARRKAGLGKIRTEE